MIGRAIVNDHLENTAAVRLGTSTISKIDELLSQLMLELRRTIYDSGIVNPLPPPHDYGCSRNRGIIHPNNIDYWVC